MFEHAYELAEQILAKLEQIIRLLEDLRKERDHARN